MSKARRAKKTTVPKKLLLIIMILITATIVYFGVINKDNSIILGKLNSGIANYESNDFVKDVFTQDKVKYLPILYDEPYEHESLTKQIVENKIKEMGMTIKSISSETIGTGTKIETNEATFTVVIYGDIDGNGRVNARDVQCIVQHLCYGGKYTLTGTSRMAANVYDPNDDSITVRDAQRIIRFIIGTDKIIDTIPISDIKKDNEKPVIQLNGPDEITVKVGEKYEELGARVTDNLSYIDVNIGKRLVITGNVNTNEIGDYTLIYSVKDLNGNEAEIKTRKVHVVNYISDIDIKTELKTQYVDGETIALPENFVAYPKMAVGGWLTTPVDNTKITITPAIATLKPGETESKVEITITYKDGYSEVSKKHTITVTEAKPIITLKTYNGAERVKLKIDENYVENVATDVTSVDKHNGNPLRVTRIIVDDENREEVTYIDSSKPGTYTITYTTEPDSMGKVGTLTRYVEVKDYIIYVTFSTDEGEANQQFKKTYVDGERVSLRGIKGITTYAYDKTRHDEISSNSLSSDVATILYDRTATGINTGRELVVSYIDPDFGTKFVSGEHWDRIVIDVVKKVETINLVTGPDLPTGSNVTDDIYEEIFVARVKSGKDEMDLTIDDIDIKVTKAGETVAVNERDNCSIPCITRAWAKPADKAVDIYFIGVNAGTYTINVTPKEKTENSHGQTLSVRTTTNDKVNCAKIGEFTRDFEGTKKIGNNASTGYKAGEVAYADIKFCHKYGKGDSDVYHYSAEEPMRAGALETPTIWRIERDATGTETGMIQMSNSQIRAEYININGNPANANNEAVKIKLTSERDIVNVATDICINIKFSQDVSDKEIRMYPTAHDTLHVGSKTDNGAPGNITLSLRALRTGENYGYQIKEIDGKYYTIIPIYVTDDYGADKTVYASELDTRITVKDLNANTNTPNTKSCIDVIGIDSRGNKAETSGTNDPAITAIGIAIKNPENGVYGEDVLANGLIQVNFDGTTAKIYNSINILKQAVSYIQYVNSKVEEEECFEELRVASVKSGDRQENISNVTYTVQEERITTDGQTSWVGTNTQKVKVKIDINAEGIADVTFSAENPGKYRINLAVNGTNMVPRNSNGSEEPIIVQVNENREINRIAIYEFNDDGTVDLDYDTNGNIRVPESISFGNAHINAVEIKAIKCFHEYKKNGVVIATREIKDVEHSKVLVKTGLKNSAGKILGTVSRMTGSTSGGFSEITSSGDLLNPKINAIQVVVSKTDETLAMQGTGKLSFVLETENSDKTKVQHEVSVIVKEELQVTGVSIGWDENSDSVNPEKLNIYTKASSIANGTPNPDITIANASSYIKTDSKGNIYTLVPISLVSGNQKVYSDELKASNINISIDGETPMGKITFIDNINLGDNPNINKDKNIAVIGFAKRGSDLIEATGDTQIDYVGIAVPKDRQYFLNEQTPNALVAPIWTQLKNIIVKFSVDGVTGKEMHRFEIIANDYVEQEYAAMQVTLINESNDTLQTGVSIEEVKKLIRVKYAKGTSLEDNVTNYEIIHLDDIGDEDGLTTIQTGENMLMIRYKDASEEIITIIGE